MQGKGGGRPMSMAPDLDMSMGMGMGMGMMPMGMMGMEATPSSFSTAYLCGLPAASDVSMRVDDLLDFSNKDESFDAAAAFSGGGENNHQHGYLPMHEPSAAAGSLDTSGSYSLSSFSDDFYMPSDEVAELEWLSRFVDDSFSDVPYSSSIEGCADGGEGAAGAATSSKYNVLHPECSSSIPGRARSKRSRAPATALHQNTSSTWSSPPPPHSPPLAASPTSPSPSLSEVLQSVNTPSKPKAAASCRKKEAAAAARPGIDGGVRRCTHCASEKTPQWRTGPLGAKTLCNACGVRYKSGRLVPEYRPAASPTFVLTQHSNSHRKVIELRRQKELLLHHHHHQGGAPAATAASPPPPGALFGGYEAC
ncbi:hypothetical protein Taro_035946 [Colocasia esculenta]|uniref:GATA-type domain-containing protein n=1 Tax=Colocasia esculenta TaxID=4460 RepID=A0A843W732_COLES|nr:hypothetical protein [Colocasia esculenta]